MNNILYVLGHKTLTDFEVPILINKGYGVLIVKNTQSLIGFHSVYENIDRYDNFLNLDIEIIKILNNIDWFSNKKVSNEIIEILNKYFKIIFLTLITSDPLLTQLITEYKGTIYYRFFGREANFRYNHVKKSENVKYIFSYKEIFAFEKSFDNFFNETNSYVIPLGLSNNFIKKWINTYKPLNNKICFICCKINNCPYYTNIYNTFVNNFKNYEYVILGKDNAITSDKIINNLNDDEYYKKISSCKLLYYHSIERRHLHYYPLEGIVLGIPIIFHKENVLSSYIHNSPGKCNDLQEVYTKINRILQNDTEFINCIIEEQNKVINIFTINYNKNIFDCILNI